MDTRKTTEPIELGDAIERILVESGLSISDFSRKVGYSRQYIYELLKTKDPNLSRKVQLDTLKRICDATGYGLTRLLTDIGYIQRPTTEPLPNSIVLVKNGGVRAEYHLTEKSAAIVGEVVKSLSKD